MKKQSEMRKMDRLREVMRLSARGKGIAASIVETFRSSRWMEETRAVRSILLGIPVEESVAGLTSGDDYSKDLLLYLVQQAKVDALEASRRADKLANLFEHWVRAKQQRLIDQRIMETRSLMVSAILGGVTGMVASIGPVISNFQLSLTQPPSSPSLGAGYTPYLGVLFVIPGAFFLGLFFSRRRALLCTALSCAIYATVAYFFAPLVLSI